MNRAAGRRALALMDRMAEAGQTPVSLLTGGADAEPFRHYPEGDLYDPSSHAQAYYHAHRAGEYGHAHLFLRPWGMPRGLKPVVPTDQPDAPCHLGAVAFGPDGWPCRLFTTNRWVTGEAWYEAYDAVEMLPCFRLAAAGPLTPVAALLTELVAFYQPLLARLLAERDRAVAAWRHPNPLDDAELEVTSEAVIDLRQD